MLKLIAEKHYPAVEAVFGPFRHHLALRALLAGAVRAQVFADDTARPTVAAAWTQQRLFMAGLAKGSGLRALIAGSVRPRLLAQGQRYLAVYYAPATEGSLLETQLAEWAPRAAVRHYYEHRGAGRDWRTVVPAGYSLRPVDRALLEDEALGHRAELKDEMCSERPSVEKFLEHSFGVAAVRGSELAGWCLSEYNHDGACEVGIETRPAHQGHGLATAMTLALLERAAQAGLTRVGWHCYAHNAASVATARAAGFELVVEYPALVVDLGEVQGT